MTYEETINFLYSQLPMYQRIGKAAYKADLGNTLKLDKYFGHPHKKYKTIHVAGTNGKGSVSHTLASVLQEAGYKVGLYTSPHYLDFRERIRINGKPVEKQFVVDFVENNKDFFMTVKPSFFEITVAMAFEYFAIQNVDVAVIEVGMGGRLDSTNIIKPILSVITNIGFDHTQFLGDTLTAIAGEKAGIIKHNVPVVVGETRVELKHVFSQKAQHVDTSLFFSDHFYNVRNYVTTPTNTIVFTIDKHGKTVYEGLEFGLGGEYQRFNVPVILTAIDILKNFFNISESDIYNGFSKVVTNTGIMGRWQKLNDKPLVITDAGHNYDGIMQVVSQLKSVPYKKLHIIFGVVEDKELPKILRLLPAKATYYFTQAQIPRALNASELKKQAQNMKLNGNNYSSVSEAIEKALQNAEDNDLIFIGGSTFVAAEAIDFFKKS